MTKLRANPWAVLLVVSLGFFMTLLDLTIVNIAVPNLITKLHASLDDVLGNVAHRTAGSGATDVLASAATRAQLVKFLNSIDGSTAPIDPPAPGVLTPVNNFNYKTSAEAPARRTPHTPVAVPRSAEAVAESDGIPPRSAAALPAARSPVGIRWRSP